MNVTEICLKWNTFHESVLSGFEILWREENLVDLTLAVEGQTILAHKMVLSACSPFFRKLFQENNCKHPVIILPGINYDEMKKLLNFMYRGEIYVEEEKLSKLLQLAEYLQIAGLWSPSPSTSSTMVVEDEPRQDIEKNSFELESTSDEPQYLMQNSSLYIKNNNCNNNRSYVTHEQISKKFKENPLENPNSLSRDKFSYYQNVIANCKTEIREIDGKEILPDITDNNFSENQFGKTIYNWKKFYPDASSYSSLSSMNLTDNDGSENTKTNSSISYLDTLKFPYQYMSLPYADRLPSPDTLQTWSQNRTLDQLACDLMKMLFTTEERIMCNVNGKMGKMPFNGNKINLIREVIQYFTNLADDMFEEQWKICVTKIDTANRGLKRRFKNREAGFSDKSKF